MGVESQLTHRGYKSLTAWKCADDLAAEIYQMAGRLHGQAWILNGQLIRAATSAPANIAEGYGRASQREFKQFLTVADGSLYEVSYFLHFLACVGAIDDLTHTRHSGSCERGSRVLYGLMRAAGAQARADARSPRFLNGISRRVPA